MFVSINNLADSNYIIDNSIDSSEQDKVEENQSTHNQNLGNLENIYTVLSEEDDQSADEDILDKEDDQSAANNASNTSNQSKEMPQISEQDDKDNLKYASKCTEYCDGSEYKLVMLCARIAHDIHAGKKNTLQTSVEWDKPTAQAIISIGRDPSKPAKILDEILTSSGDASTSIVSVADFDFFEQDNTQNNHQVADDTVESEMAALSALNNI